MKYAPIALYIIAIAMFLAMFFNPGSGWGIGATIFAVIASGWVGANIYRTGKPFTDDAAGH